MPQPLQYTHTISLRRQHDSIVYLNETCLLCATKMVFLISCRSWMTALSDTVTPTRRLFWVISTARCHQADECSSSWRESTSPNLRRMTGIEYRARSGARQTLLNQKPPLSVNKAAMKISNPRLILLLPAEPFPWHVNACMGTTASQLLYRKYTSLQRWSFTLPSEWQWVG